MPRINQGSCVGIYYRRGNIIDVHNGRLIRARYGNTWYPYVDTAFGRPPDQVQFAHWNIAGNGQPFHERPTLSRIIEVRLTPDLPSNNAFYCGAFRGPGRTGEIRPGNCIGVWFIDEQTGRRDVKNGRYLFYLDAAGQHHCVLLEGATPPARSRAWCLRSRAAGGCSESSEIRSKLLDMIGNPGIQF